MGLQACGSGGTAAGLALGARLSGMDMRVHAFGVCDDEDYFYDFIDQLLEEAGASRDVIGQPTLIGHGVHACAKWRAVHLPHATSAASENLSVA